MAAKITAVQIHFWVNCSMNDEKTELLRAERLYVMYICMPGSV